MREGDGFFMNVIFHSMTRNLKMAGDQSKRRSFSTLEGGKGYFLEPSIAFFIFCEM